MREHEVNKLDNFIMGWYSDDNDICDRLIEFWQQDSDKVPGTSGKNKVTKSIKESIDSYLDNSHDLYDDYVLDYLQRRVNKYIEKYPHCNTGDPWAVIYPVNIQRYFPPTGGYHNLHAERIVATMPMATRHLVFMTYLNTINQGGETLFLHQKLKIKPEKGLTLIWPADWTFTHKGIIAPNEEKSIATGWFNYYERPKNDDTNTRKWRMPDIC